MLEYILKIKVIALLFTLISHLEGRGGGRGGDHSNKSASAFVVFKFL